MSHRRSHQRSAYWSKRHRINVAWARIRALYKTRLIEDLYMDRPLVAYLKSKGKWE